MTKFQIACYKTWKKRTLLAMLATALVMFFVSPVFSARNHKYATITATAMGTSTQLGQNIAVEMQIYEFSSPQDRQFLIQSFETGQNKGLVNALTKMRAVGHCSITGDLGFDVAFIEVIPTATGRRIRFIASRRILFGERFYDTESKDYNVTAGEIEINDSDKKKSGGLLLPAAQVVINKQGQLEFQLLRNPWRLVNIIDWDKAGTTLG